MNFLVINKQSNLITGVITAPTAPTDTARVLFIRVGDLTLTKYSRLETKARNKGQLVDIGELAKVSHNFLDALIQTDRKSRHFIGSKR